MKLVHMIGAGSLVVAGGMVLAWSMGDRTADASIDVSFQSTAEAAEDKVTVAAPQSTARSTFDQFWTRVSADKSGLDAISIKVGVPHSTGVEHLWMTGCKSADAQVFECIVSNEPVQVALKLGTPVSFERSAITDWMYRQDGKIHGGYSIRAMLPTLPAQEAAEMTAMLAPLPQ